MFLPFEMLRRRAMPLGKARALTHARIFGKLSCSGKADVAILCRSVLL
jgi:hypothetical protein